MVGDAGETTIAWSVAAVTVSVVDPPIEPELARMVDVPGFTAVAMPRLPAALLIVATLVLNDCQVTEFVKFCVLPSEYVPVAVNCSVANCEIVGDTGETAIEISVGVITLVTVRVVDAVMAPEVAVMVAVPVVTADASPCVPAALLTVATLELDELQVTELVMTCVLPSL
jgi:hypothetical protein